MSNRPDLDPIVFKIPGAKPAPPKIEPPPYPHDDPSPKRLAAYHDDWRVFLIEHPDFDNSFGPWGA